MTPTLPQLYPPPRYSWRPLTNQCAFHKKNNAVTVPPHAGGGTGSSASGAASGGVPNSGTSDHLWTCYPKSTSPYLPEATVCYGIGGNNAKCNKLTVLANGDITKSPDMLHSASGAGGGGGGVGTKATPPTIAPGPHHSMWWEDHVSIPESPHLRRHLLL